MQEGYEKYLTIEGKDYNTPAPWVLEDGLVQGAAGVATWMTILPLETAAGVAAAGVLPPKSPPWLLPALRQSPVN